MIPLILHQIWFQGIDNIMEPYKSCFINTIIFLKNTKWEHYFWDKERIEKFILDKYSQYWDIYNNCHILVQKLDVARYIILYHYGGCYMDMDMEILKDFRELLNDEDEIVISNTRQFYYNNSILFSSINNKFWLKFLDSMDINKFKFNTFLNVQFTTGPFNFTYFINKNINNYNIKVLPYKYLEPCDTKYNQDITEDAYVINYFGNSWMDSYIKFFIKIYSMRNDIFLIMLFCLIIIYMLKPFSNRNKTNISLV
jgi:mannosyltransferase OCH1-like enzyme